MFTDLVGRSSKNLKKMKNNTNLISQGFKKYFYELNNNNQCQNASKFYTSPNGRSTSLFRPPIQRPPLKT